MPNTTAARRPWKRRSPEADADALRRAENCSSAANVATVITTCNERGYDVPAVPGVNVLTFAAWRAKGRTVRRGERGIRLVTVRETTERNTATGAETVRRYPAAAYVFHVSQTDAIAPKSNA